MKVPKFVLPCVLVCLAVPSEARISPAQRRGIDKVLLMTGQYVSLEDSYKFTFANGDLKLAVQGRVVPPMLGAQSWATFVGDPHHGGCMLIAEFALQENEVNPVLSVALDDGFEITSIGNDYLFEQPRFVSMHLSEAGEPIPLARKLEELRKTIDTIRATSPVAGSSSREGVAAMEGHPDTSRLDSILMTRGQLVQGVYEASMGMAGTVFGVPAGKQAGLSTLIAFAGNDESAVVDGQIIATPSQLRNVLRALRKGTIYVTSLHNHFIGSNPEFYFVHFWGEGSARDLALTIRQAMETQLR